VLQNWDCQGCTDCCREYHVHVTDAERQRIEAQGWQEDAALGKVPLFVREGAAWNTQYRLNQRQDGRCVFLSEQGRCRIHEKFGSAAKPLACRLYPFVLVPAGDHWRVGIRYSCPEAAANQGRPLGDYQAELATYAADLEQQLGGDGTPIPPPPLQGAQQVTWPDLLLFVKALLALLQDSDDSIERRWRKCLALANLCRQARFDQIHGARLAEFLNLVGAGLDAEVPARADEVPPPTWVGRILFRQVVALYARQDRGPHRGLAAKGRLALLGAAWRFARGTGLVPQVHGSIPAKTFKELEEPAGPLPPEVEQVLERYYRVKVGSMQFCGPNNYHLPFWEGLETLSLTLPAILWLNRAFADLTPMAAIQQAVRIVDNNFGFNPLLGGRRQRLGLSILARRGELVKLIAWYGR
jgi:lysine-N-methylase